MIIGVVGTLGAGKSTAVEYLVSRGFDYYKLSDIILEKHHLKNPPSRATRQDLGNQLRKKFGTDILAREVWEKINKSKSKKVVIDGLRNRGEVEFFRGKGGSSLISVDRNKKARFKAMKIRGSSRDPKTWEGFLKMEERDLDEKNEYGQETRKVMQMADFSITNTKNLTQFYLKIEKVLKKIESEI